MVEAGDPLELGLLLPDQGADLLLASLEPPLRLGHRAFLGADVLLPPVELLAPAIESALGFVGPPRGALHFVAASLEVALHLLAEAEDFHLAFDDGGIAEGLGFAARVGEQRLRFGAGSVEEGPSGAPANAEREPDDRSRNENAQHEPHNEPQGCEPGHGSISRRGAERRPRVS